MYRMTITSVLHYTSTCQDHYIVASTRVITSHLLVHYSNIGTLYMVKNNLVMFVCLATAQSSDYLFCKLYCLYYQHQTEYVHE